MSEDEVSKQPAEGNPGKGRGPPDESPGKGRGRKEVPGNAPFEEVKNKLSNALNNQKSEGRLGIKVEDENGNVKDRIECVRVSGLGSVEARPFEENGKQKWGFKRKDKLHGGEQ